MCICRVPPWGCKLISRDLYNSPFEITPCFLLRYNLYITEDSRQLILDSLYSIERYTCVRFREMWPHEKIENHILFYQNWDPNRG